MDVKKKLVELIVKAKEMYADDYTDRTEEEYIAETLLDNFITVRDGKPIEAFLHPIDAYKGLKVKYLVFKADTGEMVDNCFILRPDKDAVAVEALRAYAIGSRFNLTHAGHLTKHGVVPISLVNYHGVADKLTYDFAISAPIKKIVAVIVCIRIAFIRPKLQLFLIGAVDIALKGCIQLRLSLPDLNGLFAGGNQPTPLRLNAKHYCFHSPSLPSLHKPSQTFHSGTHRACPAL